MNEQDITNTINTDIVATKPMDDAELQAIISQDLVDAVSYIDSDISPTRAKGRNITVATCLEMRWMATAKWWPWRCATR